MPLFPGPNNMIKQPTSPVRTRVLIRNLAFLAIALSALTASAQICQLYPIALSAQSIDGKSSGAVIDNIILGKSSGNFGWLTWAGSPSEPTLAGSLFPPGNSETYINPEDRNDRQVSIGDWIQGKPGVSNSE